MNLTSPHQRSTPSQVSRARLRRGATVVELLVAGILLTTVAMLVTPLLLESSHLRRAASERQLATQLASNCLERLAAGQSSDEAIAALKAGWTSEPWLHGMKIVVSPGEDMSSRHVTVTVSWKSTTGTPQRQVALHGWVFTGAPGGRR